MWPLVKTKIKPKKSTPNHQTAASEDQETVTGAQKHSGCWNVWEHLKERALAFRAWFGLSLCPGLRIGLVWVLPADPLPHHWSREQQSFLCSKTVVLLMLLSDVIAQSRGGNAKQEKKFEVIPSKSAFVLWGDSNHLLFRITEAYQDVASVWGFDTWIKSLKPAPEDLEIFVKLKCTKQPLSCGCWMDQWNCI